MKDRRFEIGMGSMLSLFAKRMGPDGLPYPPKKLNHLVTATTDDEWFFKGGAVGKQSVLEAMDRNGISLSPGSRMLDFGCGCGRVIRHWKGSGWELYGSDYNKSLIRWCRKNLPFARFEANPLAPPLVFQSGFFDFIYAFSVFTHLSQDLQERWRDELRRVLKPGGTLLVTTHGVAMREKVLDDGERESFDRDELVVRKGNQAGENVCATFQSDRCTEKLFGKGFEKIEFVPDGGVANPGQDLNLYRAI